MFEVCWLRFVVVVVVKCWALLFGLSCCWLIGIVFRYSCLCVVCCLFVVVVVVTV